MKENLLKASQKGEITKDLAKILNEIIILFEKLDEKEIARVLSQYKIKTDDQIFDELLHLNLNLSDELQTESAQRNFKRSFIQIKEISMDIWELKAISKIDTYDYNKKIPLYQIILNPSQEEGYLMNMNIDYLSAELRNKEIINLQKKLKNSGVVFI